MQAIHLARKLTVQLRRVRGTHPLVDAVRRRFYAHGVREVADFDGDLRIALDLREHMASQIFWFGYYNRDVVRWLRRLLPAGGVFFDVGANIGEITLVAAKRVGTSGAVYAFEPMAAIHAKLAANVAANGFSQVRLVASGVSDRPGTQAIYASTGLYCDGSEHEGLGTLYATAERGRLSAEIDLTTIDAVVGREGLTRLDGIKLDIEGAELPAIRGAAESLRRFRPWLIVEIGTETCEAAGYEPADLLAALPGYRFSRIERHRLVPITAADLGSWQNVLCTPADG
ncbi:MAG: FkbM family methyltransferase [Methylobacterium frigidaeris]